MDIDIRQLVPGTPVRLSDGNRLVYVESVSIRKTSGVNLVAITLLSGLDWVLLRREEFFVLVDALDKVSFLNSEVNFSLLTDDERATLPLNLFELQHGNHIVVQIPSMPDSDRLVMVDSVIHTHDCYYDVYEASKGDRVSHIYVEPHTGNVTFLSFSTHLRRPLTSEVTIL